MSVTLFDDKKNCCGCGACANICPKQAISMTEDAQGFIYPNVDESKCVECGLCEKACAYQNQMPQNKPINIYAAVNRNQKQLLHSASGGAFSAIASQVLQDGGVVFGATLDFQNGHAWPHHKDIISLDQLPLLQGSKYVHSEIGTTYKSARSYLKAGKTVLFSGTPCQVAGLYGYLGKDFENLITVDVICHGVPNAKMFDDYLQHEKNRLHADAICGYSFRDKSKGWGMNGRIDLRMKNQAVRHEYIPARLNSYNTLFLDGVTYRENCYSCKYAGEIRSADLTIGDYWGIEKEHPELLKSDVYNERNGISCILANTEKGCRVCESLQNLCQTESTFEKVSRKNGQLQHPSLKPDNREQVMKIYEHEGYEAVDAWYHRHYRKQILVHRVYNAIPRNIRIKLKAMIKR